MHEFQLKTGGELQTHLARKREHVGFALAAVLESAIAGRKINLLMDDGYKLNAARPQHASASLPQASLASQKLGSRNNRCRA